jgi:DNA-directed RNA polymerase specialized sigma24 family protein
MTDSRRATPAARQSQARSALDVEAVYPRLFLPLVRRVCWRKHVPLEDAKDIVQEAFSLALRKMPDDSNPMGWFTRVVDNLASNFRRKSARRAELAERWIRSDWQEEVRSQSISDEENND